MSEKSLKIVVNDADRAQAASDLKELRDLILNQTPDVPVLLERDSPSAQDFGPVLSVLFPVLAQVSVHAVMLALQSWLARRRSSSITVSVRDQQITIDRMTSDLQSELAEKVKDLLGGPPSGKTGPRFGGLEGDPDLGDDPGF